MALARCPPFRSPVTKVTWKSTVQFCVLAIQREGAVCNGDNTHIAPQSIWRVSLYVNASSHC